MGLEIEDVPLTHNFAPQVTLIYDIQAPSSSFAIRVEKLVGHSECEDGGLLTDAVLEGRLLSLDRAPCENSKNH
jgi:hypothetical protein